MFSHCLYLHHMLVACWEAWLTVSDEFSRVALLAKWRKICACGSVEMDSTHSCLHGILVFINSNSLFSHFQMFNSHWIEENSPSTNRLLFQANDRCFVLSPNIFLKNTMGQSISKILSWRDFHELITWCKSKDQQYVSCWESINHLASLV